MHTDLIQNFLDHFRTQATLIAKVDTIAHRKILYVTALDAIARAAFGKSQGQRARSVRMIDELTQWKERDGVSLPQLCIALREKNFVSSALYRAASGHLLDWPDGAAVRLEKSPLLSELKVLATPEENCVLSSCRYAELFCTYRNSLVHEFREPGYGMEMPTDGVQPYYHSSLNGSWELVFPVRFFSDLYSDVLTELETRLVSRDANPYTQFEFGAKWRAN